MSVPPSQAPGKDLGYTLVSGLGVVGADEWLGGAGGISPTSSGHLWFSYEKVTPKAPSQPDKRNCLSASPKTPLLGGLFPTRNILVHLRHSGGRKENPSENHNVITPICSGTASHFCLPGCLSPMLSSTLFSISCNHLLEMSFSFKMSPWKGNSATWEWAETAMIKPIQQQPSSGRRASAPPELIKTTQQVSL